MGFPMGFLTSWSESLAKGLPLPRGRHSEEGKDVSVTSPGEDSVSYERHFQWVIQITAKVCGAGPILHVCAWEQAQCLSSV